MLIYEVNMKYFMGIGYCVIYCGPYFSYIFVYEGCQNVLSLSMFYYNFFRSLYISETCVLY